MFASIVDQHASVAAFLWLRREAAVGAFHHTLATLADLDERIEAHLDGLRVAGDLGWTVALAALEEEPHPGALFVAAAVALERGDLAATARLFELGGASDLRRGLVSALAWSPLESVATVITALNSARRPELREIGLAAAVAHRHDPGAALTGALADGNPSLRARALRAVGELGRVDLLAQAREQLPGPEALCRLEAAWSLALRGDADALEVLKTFAQVGGPARERAADLLARRLELVSLAPCLPPLAEVPRLAIINAAASGDPAHVPWLIEQMAQPALARIAGEAFASISGIEVPRDLAAPGDLADGPNDDPADDDVALAADEHLVWPDRPAVARL